MALSVLRTGLALVIVAMRSEALRQEATERAARKALGLRLTGPLAPADQSRVASKRLELEDAALKDEIRTRFASTMERAAEAGVGDRPSTVEPAHWLWNVWKALGTKLLKAGSEDLAQAQLIAWCDGPGAAEFPELRFVFHVANGGGRSKAQAGLFRLLGVRPGVPDLVHPFARGGYTHLYLEMKREGTSRLSEAQPIWHQVLREAGAKVAVCHGFEAGKLELLAYSRRPVTIHLNERPTLPLP